MNSLETTPKLDLRTLPKLTKLEKKWYKEYLQCFNSSDALRRAYPDNKYSFDSIRTIAAQTKKKVFAKLSIDDVGLLDLMGLSEEKLHQKLLDKLEAKKVLIVDGKAHQVEDHQSQLKALEMSYKLTGKMSDTQKVEVTGKDGEPLRLNVIAGLGFISPEKKDA